MTQQEKTNPAPVSQPLDELIAQSKVRLAAMTEEERQAMWQAQRESMVRAMTTGCEHGVLDFEDCPQCRSPSPSPQMVGVTDAERLEDLRLAAKAIRTYMPETLPADEHGKIHFARALAEAAADAIEAALTTEGQP